MLFLLFNTYNALSNFRTRDLWGHGAGKVVMKWKRGFLSEKTFLIIKDDLEIAKGNAIIVANLYISYEPIDFLCRLENKPHEKIIFCNSFLKIMITISKCSPKSYF